MNVGTALAKLSGIKQALESVLNENVSRNKSQGEVRVRGNYEPALVQHYFSQAKSLVDYLRVELPRLVRGLSSHRHSPEYDNELWSN